MRISLLRALLATVVPLAVLVAAPHQAGADPARPAAPAGPELIPDQYLVVLKPDVSAAELLGKLGVQPLFSYSKVFPGFAAKLNSLQLATVRNTPGVQAVEQDAVVTALDVDTMDDKATAPRAPASWGLDRIDQRDLPLNNAYTTSHDGAGVTAYIVDSGIDFTHNEFGGRARPGFDAINDGRNGADCHGHGTHVAGTVGGTTYGVAPKVNLVSVRVLGCDGRGSWSGIVAGFDWLASHAAKPAVANVSLGGTPPTQAVDTAADAVTDAGVFTSVAGGNDAADACNYSPARASKVFTIGATTNTDGYASYSNRGQCIQLLAPGTDIVSAKAGGGSVAHSGTSMAAPHVAGVAALYKQANGEISQEQLMQWFWSHATVNVVKSVPANTPNYLLNTGGL